MGDRDLFGGAGDRVVTTTGAQGGRDEFTGAGDRDLTASGAAAGLPGELHAVWGRGNCKWKPDTDQTHPAVQAWQSASKEHWHDPIKLEANGYYTVKYPDCLDSVASRVIETTTGKPPTTDQLTAEKAAIIQANQEHYPDLACNPHFLGAGWKLALPGLTNQEPAAPEPRPEAQARPKPETERREPPPEGEGRDRRPETDRRPHQRFDGGITIDNESGGTVNIYEGGGGRRADADVGPPAPLDGRTDQSAGNFVSLPPPPPMWGRSLSPEGGFFVSPEIIFGRGHRRPGWPPQQGWEQGQPGWGGQTQNFGQTWTTPAPTWGAPQQNFAQQHPQMSYWQYQQWLRTQRDQRAAMNGFSIVQSTSAPGSDWVD